jgi:hypothetical protein
MKFHQLLMVAVLATTVLCGSAAAEYQDRMFGNGRFLRRLRDDITGNSTPKKPTPVKSSAKQPKSKAPTPIRKPSSAKSKVPTPIVGSGKVSTSKTRTNKSPASPIAGPSSATNQAKRSTKKSTIGFGMLLETRGEAIVVTQVASKGNASDAGIKAGDVIQGAGGVDLTSLEEFNEISTILGQGDQLEFNVVRRGKKKDILIQFGTAPDEGEIAKTPAPKKKNDYSFVPQGVDKSQAGLRSVMKQPAQLNRPSSIQRPSQRNQVDSFQSSQQQRIIKEQQLKIQQMQREIKRLQQRSQVAPMAVPTPAQRPGKTILQGPSLSGPGN